MNKSEGMRAYTEQSKKADNLFRICGREKVKTFVKQQIKKLGLAKVDDAGKTKLENAKEELKIICNKYNFNVSAQTMHGSHTGGDVQNNE